MNYKLLQVKINLYISFEKRKKKLDEETSKEVKMN